MEQKKKYSAKGLIDDLKEDLSVESAKQKKLEQTKEGRGVDPKGKGSNWRKEKRPNQKTIHFDDELDRKINLYKQLTNKSIEDIIYDIVAEWFATNYEEEVKKKLLGQL